MTVLNLQVIRIGLAETQEAIARTNAADNPPELLALPLLLVPEGAAQALSYGRQFFETMSGLARGSAPLQ